MKHFGTLHYTNTSRGWTPYLINLDYSNASLLREGIGRIFHFLPEVVAGDVHYLVFLCPWHLTNATDLCMNFVDNKLSTMSWDILAKSINCSRARNCAARRCETSNRGPMDDGESPLVTPKRNPGTLLHDIRRSDGTMLNGCWNKVSIRSYGTLQVYALADLARAVLSTNYRKPNPIPDNKAPPPTRLQLWISKITHLDLQINQEQILLQN